MNILVNCLSSMSGGAITYVKNILPKLNDLFKDSNDKHSLQFLAHEEQRSLLLNIPEDQCILLKDRRPVGYQRFLWEKFNLPRIIKENNIDVLFVPYQISPIINGIKQVMMARNMEPFFFKKYKYKFKPLIRNYILQWQTSHALGAADKVIAVSRFCENHLINDLDIRAERVRRIYHGRDLSFSPDGNLDDDQRRLKKLGINGNYLFTVGSLLPYRRCEDVIEAFNLIACAHDEKLNLVIAGNGSDTGYVSLIKQAIKKSPYNGRILLIGHVQKENMISLYRKSTACIIASEIEACPNIAIEAMSSGCNIISSNSEPLPEMFNGCSLTYEARSIKDMVKQILIILNDLPIRNNLRERALHRASTFSWKSCAEETYDALVSWPSN